MDPGLMERILEASRRAAETWELDALLGDVVDESISLAGAEYGTIVLAGPDGSFRTRVRRGHCGPGQEDAAAQLVDSIPHHIICTDRPLVLQDAAHDPRFRHPDGAAISGLHSLLGVPLESCGNVIGAICVADRSDGGRFVEDDLSPLVLLANQVAEHIACACRLETVVQARTAELKRVNERLRSMAEHLAEAEELERRRLARELHDQAGQDLTALGVSLEIIRVLLAECAIKVEHDDQAVRQLYSRLNDASELIKTIAVRMRDVMAYLRPPALEEQGLLDALEWYGFEFSSRTGMVVDVRGVEGIPAGLSVAVKKAFFRIAQEALSNVARHARASQATVTVTLAEGVLRMVIADDGIGFVQQPAVPGAHKPDERQCWGLLSMAERARAMGGHCRVESAPGQGTNVIAEVYL